MLYKLLWPIVPYMIASSLLLVVMNHTVVFVHLLSIVIYIYYCRCNHNVYNPTLSLSINRGVQKNLSSHSACSGLSKIKGITRLKIRQQLSNWIFWFVLVELRIEFICSNNYNSKQDKKKKREGTVMNIALLYQSMFPDSLWLYLLFFWYHEYWSMYRHHLLILVKSKTLLLLE